VDRLLFLDHLTIRPPPEHLESFGSYLLRTAQCNGVDRLFRWKNSLRLTSQALRDLPPSNFGEMARLLNVTTDQLLTTTFYYVREKFLCDGKQLISLLRGVLGKGLRYCPVCLAETGYYRLPWRLLTIPGCEQHHCRLRETCPHCGQALPLIPIHLKLGVCEYCGSDLADAPVVGLTDEEWVTTHVRTVDMTYLLQPQPVIYHLPVAEKLARLRQLFGISLDDLARCLRLEKAELWHFEHHPSRSILERYLNYADYLELSLREVLAYREHAIDMPQEEIGMIRAVGQARRQVLIAQANTYESELLQRVVAAVTQLRADGQSDRQIAISQRIRVDPARMILYPRVKQYLEQVERERAETNLQTRLREIQTAMAQLSAQDEPPLAERISQLVGYNVQKLRYYPEIDELIASAIALAKQYMLVWDDDHHRPGYQHRTRVITRIQDLLAEAEQAGSYMLKTEVARRIGARYGTLRDDPEIGSLLKAHEEKRIQQWYAQTLQAIETAYQQLCTQHQRVSINAIGRLIGLRRSELVRYAALWERVTALVATYEQVHETELLTCVQEVVRRLRIEGHRVTLAAIGQRVGMAPMNLKRYPTILDYFNSLPELPTPLVLPKR